MSPFAIRDVDGTVWRWNDTADLPVLSAERGKRVIRYQLTPEEKLELERDPIRVLAAIRKWMPRP